MTTNTFLDSTSLLSCRERGGTIIEMTRRGVVVGVTSSSYEGLLAALEAADIPAPGTILGVAGFDSLILTERSVKLIDPSDKGSFYVDLMYELQPSDVQNINSPPNGLLYGEISTTLEQSTSNLDANGNEVTVSYTYPSDDPDFPSATQTQGGEFPVFQPQITQSYEGLYTTRLPQIIAASIVNKVNVSEWAGGDPGTWLCMNCSYKPWNSGINPTWKMSFSFQYKQDGWNPTVIFKDQRTNKPPEGLVAGVGYVTVTTFQSVDFQAVLGIRVQGG